MKLSIEKSPDGALVLKTDELHNLAWIVRDPELWVPGDEREQAMKKAATAVRAGPLESAKQLEVSYRLDIKEAREATDLERP